MTAMKLTTIYLGNEERKALVLLAHDSGKTQSECIRVAIRGAAKALATKEWDEDEIVERAARPRVKTKGFR